MTIATDTRPAPALLTTPVNPAVYDLFLTLLGLLDQDCIHLYKGDELIEYPDQLAQAIEDGDLRLEQWPWPLWVKLEKWGAIAT